MFEPGAHHGPLHITLNTVNVQREELEGIDLGWVVDGEILCTVWEDKYVVFTQTEWGWEGFSCNFWVYSETSAQ